MHWWRPLRVGANAARSRSCSSDWSSRCRGVAIAQVSGQTEGAGSLATVAAGAVCAGAGAAAVAAAVGGVDGGGALAVSLSDDVALAFTPSLVFALAESDICPFFAHAMTRGTAARGRAIHLMGGLRS